MSLYSNVHLPSDQSGPERAVWQQSRKNYLLGYLCIGMWEGHALALKSTWPPPPPR